MSLRKIGEYRPSRVNAHIQVPDNVVVKLYWDAEWETFRVDAVVGAAVFDDRPAKLSTIINAEPEQVYPTLMGGRVVARYETGDMTDARFTAISMLTSTLTGLRQGRPMPQVAA